MSLLCIVNWDAKPEENDSAEYILEELEMDMSFCLEKIEMIRRGKSMRYYCSLNMAGLYDNFIARGELCRNLDALDKELTEYREKLADYNEIKREQNKRSWFFSMLFKEFLRLMVYSGTVSYVNYIQSDINRFREKVDYVKNKLWEEEFIHIKRLIM